MRQFIILLILIILLFLNQTAVVAYNIDTNDRIYQLLSKLEAEGLIHSGLLTTKPLSKREVIDLILEAENSQKKKSPFMQQLIRFLKVRFRDDINPVKYIKPIDQLYGEYVYSDSDEADKLTYNNDGIKYEKNSNLRFGFSSVADFQWFSAYVNPEIRYSDEDVDLVSHKIYGTINYAGITLEAGKDTHWWGPGYHGAILMTINPEPFTMIKLSNSRPVQLPSVLRHLGLFKLIFFTTQLEEDREISNPFLWGLRVNFKPSSSVEIGVTRTALLGGDGRPEGFSTWIKSFTGKDENTAEGAGDQRAGFDVKLTFPFMVQPFQLYAEGAGEDEAGGFPSNWAYLVGFYMPRIATMEQLELRAEYANNHVGGKPNVWYNHFLYKSGYTYKGNIIGHHMGTDSEDIFIEGRYIIRRGHDGYISFIYDRERHNLSGEVKETEDEYSIKINYPVSRKLTLNAKYSFDRVKNINSKEGSNENISVFKTHILYRF